MIINHLTFEADVFLSVLEKSEEDETVFYLHPTCERIWKGSTTKQSKIIACMIEEEEISEIRDLYRILLGEMNLT